jgi:hypothetical protein
MTVWVGTAEIGGYDYTAVAATEAEAWALLESKADKILDDAWLLDMHDGARGYLDYVGAYVRRIEIGTVDGPC